MRDAKQEAGTMSTWTKAKVRGGRVAFINLDNVSLIVPKGSGGTYVYFTGAKDDKVAVVKLRKSCWQASRAPLMPTIDDRRRRHDGSGSVLDHSRTTPSSASDFRSAGLSVPLLHV